MWSCFNPVLGFLVSATWPEVLRWYATQFQSRAGFSGLCDFVTPAGAFEIESFNPVLGFLVSATSSREGIV